MTATSVLTAIMATCIATGSLFVAALLTKSSVNSQRLMRNMCLGVVAACVLNLFLLLFMLVTWQFHDRTLIMVSSMLTCLGVAVYIVFVLLMIIVPDAMDREDYILGALRLYLEIARLFFYLLVLLGNKK